MERVGHLNVSRSHLNAGDCTFVFVSISDHMTSVWCVRISQSSHSARHTFLSVRLLLAFKQTSSCLLLSRQQQPAQSRPPCCSFCGSDMDLGTKQHKLSQQSDVITKPKDGRSKLKETTNADISLCPLCFCLCPCGQLLAFVPKSPWTETEGRENA